MVCGEFRFAWEWVLSSEYGQEKRVMREAEEHARLLDVPSGRIQDMLTAVSEACLNAAEHGNALSPELPVRVKMLSDDKEVIFRVYDQGSGLRLGPDAAAPRSGPLTPSRLNMDKEDPRGWGLMLIYSLADRIAAGREDGSYYIEIGFSRQEAPERSH